MRTFTSTLLVAAALLVAASGPAPAAAQQAPDRELSVATYNIHHAAGVDDRLDLERIAGEIERGGADVVGLQEVDRHWSARSALADQAGWLAERLGMHVVYAANLDLDPLEPGQPRRQYGTAVLSEFPILWSRNTLLPRPRGGEQRGLLEAVLNVRGVRVRFANTHLQHNSAEERLAQAQRVAELLGDAQEPTVLVGDLNARPEAPELAPLWSHLEDAWTRGGDGAGNTYPAEAPDRRIDYVLVTPDVGVRSAEVLASPASDHLQVTADLVVEGSRVGEGHPASAAAGR
jgi:endonuclease/exonuclease/phosphatase family metal-dependent hydrolase